MIATATNVVGIQPPLNEDPLTARELADLEHAFSPVGAALARHDELYSQFVPRLIAEVKACRAAKEATR